MNAPASLTDELLSQLQGAPLQQIASQLGTNPSQAQSAVAAALPMLLGALGRNAAQPQGAADLFGALQRDHVGRAAGGGGLGDLLGSVLGGMGGGGGAGGAADGASILGHIFGGNQQRAEAGLGQATGLGANAGQLLQILAPIVMAFLAQRTQAGGMDAGGLGAVLGREHAQVRQQGGVGGDLLGSLLDQDGDGQVGLGDLIKIGGGLLGGRR
ncbi:MULTISPECIES: DUF937 domain-containing protein [unclassified Acidovorax]|jgi:hypothetical protein|uniref:DUF937 domain-containing protein n=1 Tax=unclassified Acidovorax TaxID=2684926 RepID=UPI000BC801FA|nr:MULTISPECIES: DUF937 domain-containing protein [unclassified Acidovorax]OZA56263.1 MAG: calcium-binding protein [Acidovorax sp. 17-64-282]HQS19630.1 DUF937 domain-containing protein [Acidovorax defluvii]OYY27869.1 MAG: calcium-binding protein [Acidovorax sp. 35-64-16]OYY82849.1 MAG: calcium-binding protein [Acidovorax sp. 28-64-14]OYZ42934.1 MAG: calcium-binding protein [Acidovorax sp. 16-64-162]